MVVLEYIDKLIHKRLSQSSKHKDDEYEESEKTRKINNVIAAPAPTPPPTRNPVDRDRDIESSNH